MWRRAHQLGPLLAAAFAHSPTSDGDDFRPVSRRQQVWAATDPSRTRPVGPAPRDWHPYILEAQVMFRDGGASEVEPSTEPGTFAEWLASDDPPTQAELDLHLTTLFPPLRPRGYLELRMIDALPHDGRTAAIATVWTLLTDAAVGNEAARACTTLVDPWGVATREGLQDAAVGSGARRLLDIVATRLRASHPPLARACERWRARIEAGTVATTVEELLETAERLR